jgi:hypothetical protein
MKDFQSTGDDSSPSEIKSKVHNIIFPNFFFLFKAIRGRIGSYEDTNPASTKPELCSLFTWLIYLFRLVIICCLVGFTNFSYGTAAAIASALGYNEFDFFLEKKNTDPLMGAKLKSKTRLQNTFFDL